MSTMDVPPDSGKKRSYSAKAAAKGKDLGKPGKQFATISRKAATRTAARPRHAVAGAVLNKLRNK